MEMEVFILHNSFIIFYPKGKITYDLSLILINHYLDKMKEAEVWIYWRD